MPADSTISRLLVAVAVLATAGITVWSMIQTGLAPAWSSDTPHWSSRMTERVWPQPAVDGVGPVRVVAAAVAGIPAITAGVMPLHEDRGVCTNCHSVLTPQAQLVPSIHASSSQTHDWRGVCTNCHRIALPPLAGGPAGPGGGFGALPPPREGEWLGLEVAPVTRLTASQFGLTPAAQGVVVTEVEGAAARAGARAGDLVVGVGSFSVRSVSDFVAATRGGTRAPGPVAVVRGNQPMSIDLAGTPPAALLAPGGAPATLENPAPF